MGVRVFIIGSCVSRDIFNVDRDRKFDLLDYYARSSMAVWPTLPYQNDDALIKISSPFQKKMVSRDFLKEIVKDPRLEEAEVILLDLIDERFDLICVANECLITASAELVGNGFLRSPSNSFRLVKAFSVERRRLWLKGVSQFMADLRQRNLIDKVVVNKVFWASKFEGDEAGKVPAPGEQISEANQELKWMYGVLEKYLSKHQFMDFDASMFKAKLGHAWGESPFHYIDDYYTTALSKLEILSADRVAQCAQGDANGKEMISGSRHRWEAFNWSSLDDFLFAKDLRSGMHSIPLGQVGGIEFQYEFFVSARPGKALLCHFHGNAPRGDATQLPIVTGFGVTGGIDASLFIPSDPALALDPALSLAWHFGFEGVRLQELTVKILLKIQTVLNATRIVAWGGSGGGFAAIRVAREIPGSVAMVWNPQTDILHYVKDFVEVYREVAFSNDDVIPTDERQFVSLCTDQFVEGYQGGIIYLQEKTDWHVDAHLKRFLTAWEIADVDGLLGSPCHSGFVNDKFYLHLDHWGQGHVPPRKDVITRILKILAAPDFQFGQVELLPLLCSGESVPLPVSSDSMTVEDGSAAERLQAIFKPMPQREQIMDVSEVLSIEIDRISDDFLPFDKSVSLAGDEVRLPLFTGEMMLVQADGQVDWMRTFGSQVNSSIMWLFSLAPLGRLLSTFQRTGDSGAFRLAVGALSSFIEYESIPERRTAIGKIASADHSTATRVRVLVKFIQAFRVRSDVDVNLLSRVCASLKYWSDWLLQEKNYKANNHGLMGSIALLHSAIQFGRFHFSKEYLEVASGRVGELASSAFDRDGLCNENSIGYHNFNLHCYRTLLDFCRHYRLPGSLIETLEDVCSRASVALQYCVWQGGFIPPIGDSPIYKVNVASINNSKFFPQSSFAVVKSDDLYLSVICGAPTEIHKQVDDSSVTLRFKGHDVLVDGGSYLYDRSNPHRRCVESSLGHSGVFLKAADGLLRSEFLRKYGSPQGKIERFEESGDGVRIRCAYVLSEGRFRFVRNIYVAWPDEVVLVDVVEGASAVEDFSAVHRFIFGSAMSVESGGNGYLRLTDGDFSGSVFHLSPSDLDLYRGQEEGAVRGWCSVKYNEILPTFGADFQQTGECARFSTIIKLSDVASVDECSAGCVSFARGVDRFFE